MEKIPKATAIISTSSHLLNLKSKLIFSPNCNHYHDLKSTCLLSASLTVHISVFRISNQSSDKLKDAPSISVSQSDEVHSVGKIRAELE